VETIGFDYRQRHIIELECRQQIRDEFALQFPDWSKRLGDDHRLDLGVLGAISDTALTRDMEIKMRDDTLPNTFVPGRNLLFLTFAACVAFRRGLKHIVGGMCETDYSGYPDCRDDTIKSLQATLNLGMATRFVLHTPLMWIDKAQTWKLARDLGGIGLVDLIAEFTHTCYHGDRTHRHDWGYGCATCPACKLRADGFSRYRHLD
jgi:7-cyano-7-deazaguanine synthase